VHPPECIHAPRWRVLLTTEDAAFVDAPAAPRVHIEGDYLQIAFARPAAIVLQAD
jgi:hypothetical protein